MLQIDDAHAQLKLAKPRQKKRHFLGSRFMSRLGGD